MHKINTTWLNRIDTLAATHTLALTFSLDFSLSSLDSCRLCLLTNIKKMFSRVCECGSRKTNIMWSWVCVIKINVCQGQIVVEIAKKQCSSVFVRLRSKLSLFLCICKGEKSAQSERAVEMIVRDVYGASFVVILWNRECNFENPHKVSDRRQVQWNWHETIFFAPSIEMKVDDVTW